MTNAKIAQILVIIAAWPIVVPVILFIIILTFGLLFSSFNVLDREAANTRAVRFVSNSFKEKCELVPKLTVTDIKELPGETGRTYHEVWIKTENSERYNVITLSVYSSLIIFGMEIENIEIWNGKITC